MVDLVDEPKNGRGTAQEAIFRCGGKPNGYATLEVSFPRASQSCFAILWRFQRRAAARVVGSGSRGADLDSRHKRLTLAGYPESHRMPRPQPVLAVTTRAMPPGRMAR